MAGYKAHIAFGVVSAFSLSIVVVLLSLVSIELVPLVFLLTVIGAVLPDVDSDTGIPVKLLFLMLSIFTLLPKAYFWIKHQYTIDIKQQHPISPMSYCNR
jgi:hypothetical protein